MQTQITLTATSNFDTTERVNAFPISRGPYCGVDYIHMEAICAGRFGKQSLRRVTADGEVIKEYGEYPDFATACAEVQKIIQDQQNRDCNAVTGNGRWSCD